MKYIFTIVNIKSVTKLSKFSEKTPYCIWTRIHLKTQIHYFKAVNFNFFLLYPDKNLGLRFIFVLMKNLTKK